MNKYIFADARHTWYWSSIRQLSNFCHQHETDIWNGRGNGVNIVSINVFSILFVTPQVVLVSPESDPELFNAAVVSLGMLGVITEVTLQCEDTFLLEETTVNHPIDYCVSHYDELAHSAEFVKFWMEPNSKVCHVYLSNKTTKSPQNNRYRLVRNTEVLHEE